MKTNNEQPLLRIQNITKSYGSLVANDDISFSINKGNIHCLLGENGAGKSTLAKIIYGASQPDSGKLFFDDQEVNFSSPRDAIQTGIGMVHQHFVLSEPMNAVENIIVAEESQGFFLDIKKAKKKVNSLCEQYGISMNLSSPVSELAVGEQQWVEILKALYAGVDLLLLDEPTAVLTPQEVENLFMIIKNMAESGISVVLITHKLHEVMDVSDKVTVLRKGKVVATQDTVGSTRASLAKLLVGKEFSFNISKDNVVRGDPALELDNISIYSQNQNQLVNSVNLNVHTGEILGLAGVSGNGQSEIFDAVVGVRQVASGKILLDSEDISHYSPSLRARKGLAGIPQDRLRQGLIGEFPVKDNLILGFHRTAQFNKSFVIRSKNIKIFSELSIKDFNIATMGPDQITTQLSGGNIQKIILAREFSRPVKALIANSPTRGLDINATYYVYDRFLELRRNGAGIFLISEDLDEIMNIADRIAVIYNGTILGLFNSSDVNKETLGLLMAGVTDDD